MGKGDLSAPGTEPESGGEIRLSARTCRGGPDIFNTDQGAQFTSCDFLSVLKNNEIKFSTGKADGWIMSLLNVFGGV